MPLARGALAVLVAVLPARWWPRLGPRLPVRTAAGLSGVLTMFLVFSLGIPGFMRYAEGFTAAAQEAVAASDDPFAFPKMLFGPLAPLEFAFGTFLGLVATYLCVTGAVRALTTLSDDPRGDPLLTLLDGILAGAADAVGDGRARWSRARREGRAVPDRLVPRGLGRGRGGLCRAGRATEAGLEGGDRSDDARRLVPIGTALGHAVTRGAADRLSADRVARWRGAPPRRGA